ncbi:MAG: hypothetical protein FK733_00875 [Asgard group archaeon]|nr:hypothetical protein [Asgard group archaeon]
MKPNKPNSTIKCFIFLILLMLLIVPISRAEIVNSFCIDRTDKLLNINETIKGGLSIYANDTFVYILEDYFGLDIYNISNRNQPDNIVTYKFPWTTSGDYSNLIVRNDYVFFYSYDTNTITILDCTDFSDISIKANYTLSGDKLNNFAIQDWYFFTISDTEYKVYDFTNFLPLSLIGSYTNSSSLFTDLIIQDNYSYVLEAMKGTTILNISDLSNIKKASEFILNESSYFPAFQISNDNLFISEEEEGLHVIDITDPFNPTYVTKYIDKSYYFGDFCIRGNYVYITHYDTFEILNLTNLPIIQLVGRYESEYIAYFEGIDVLENTVYLLSTQSGELQGRRPLYIVDITNPATPVHIFPGDPYSGFFDNLVKALLLIIALPIGIIIGVVSIIYIIIAVIGTTIVKKKDDKNSIDGSQSSKNQTNNE